MADDDDDNNGYESDSCQDFVDLFLKMNSNSETDVDDKSLEYYFEETYISCNPVYAVDYDAPCVGTGCPESDGVVPIPTHYEMGVCDDGLTIIDGVVVKPNSSASGVTAGTLVAALFAVAMLV